MANSRGLITDTEFDRIAGNVDVEDKRKYEAVSRVRRRIKEQLPEEIEMLNKHHPKLLDELRETVCTDGKHALEAGDRKKTPFGYVEITNTGIVTGSSEEFDRQYGRMDTPPWYKQDDEDEE